jgi:hypothetical protein
VLIKNFKIEVSPKITEEVYKMPRSKRILMFLLPRRYFICILTTYYARNKTRVKRKSVLYIKRVGRKTFDFINLDQCVPVQTHC